LSEWIVEAAALDGYRAHGTSTPGVAQRTGATTYYVELVTDRDATEDPAFSLYPVPGALDVLLAPEFLEVGRMIEAGFVSPARTTVVCSTHRLYTIHEKTATGGAIYPRERLDALARATARRLVAFDADLGALPDAVRGVVEHALPRLVDYQDAPYARRYLTRLRPFAAREAVGAIVARHLATWMTYEDAIRVAQAKTRASRFARIRGEMRAGDAVIEVTDYLKPDLDEIWGILPHRLVAPFALRPK